MIWINSNNHIKVIKSQTHKLIVKITDKLNSICSVLIMSLFCPVFDIPEENTSLRMTDNMTTYHDDN